MNCRTDKVCRQRPTVLKSANRKCIKRVEKENGIAGGEMVVCAEFTGRYIYPLVCACDELGVFLWMEDPTRIKNSFGGTRDKDDRVDARVGPFRYTSGKSIHSKSIVSQRANKQMKSLLHLGSVCVATHMKSGEHKQYYERKIKEGKHPMCVLNAIREKIVSKMFAVIRKDEPYKKVHPLLQPDEKNSKNTLPFHKNTLKLFVFFKNVFVNVFF